MLYSVTYTIWNIVKKLWLTLIIAFLIALAANLAVVQTTDFSKTMLVTVLNWFALLGLIQKILLSAFGLFLAITLCSVIIIVIENLRSGGEPLHKYLRFVLHANEALSPAGIAQQSQALISVNVPLDEIFIHLNAVPDRPVYQLPSEQQRLLEELRQRSDLSMTPEEREERIQRLRMIWYTQLGHQREEKSQRQNVSIEEVLQQLKAKQPVAVILGTPGSGKSTTMRWLALHMAKASLRRSYPLPKELFPRQIPILLHISDYAKRLSTEDLSFEDFFIKYLIKIHPQLPKRLLSELKRGHCLLLFDGLDEVSSDSLRRQVAKNIYEFISRFSSEKRTARLFNRFIVTSRIVGYEAGAFSQYAHYTLRDLQDKQIKRFLNNWCPAVERYMVTAAQGMKPLSYQQRQQANSAGKEQENRLWETLQNSPGIKRLAVNPLMLTILALIQRTGKTLPHRRIDLYQMVTLTLLQSWNQDTGRRVFSEDEIRLAEQILSDLAYLLHSRDPVVTEQDVKIIVREASAKFYEQLPSKISDSTIQEFIDTLRYSSGLFVESGQGLFSFMHRTFQEYYVAQYLLRKSPDDLSQFAKNNYHSIIWREPLLLSIAYRSGQLSSSERQQASDLIQAILDAGKNDYDSFLHRHLLFATSSIVDCSARSINTALQHHIINELFVLYGDTLGNGRYTELQESIEEVVVLWLRGQPEESSQQNSWPPLLEAWRTALYNAKHPVLQEGAISLLSVIAPELPSCPKSVLLALVPPLLQLANLLDWPHPPEVSTQLDQPLYSTSPKITTSAWVTLNLLGTQGPLGWLSTALLKWQQERPELLGRLRQHLFELNIDLFRINDLFTYLLWRLIEREDKEASRGILWRVIWDDFLREEMAHGRSATYQACLALRLLLCEGDERQRWIIGDELMRAISVDVQQTIQILIIVVNIYLKFEVDIDSLRVYEHENIVSHKGDQTIHTPYAASRRTWRVLHRRRKKQQSQLTLSELKFKFFQLKIELKNRVNRIQLPKIQLPKIQFIQFIAPQRRLYPRIIEFDEFDLSLYLKFKLPTQTIISDLREMQSWLYIFKQQNILSLQDKMDLRNILNRGRIVETLLKLLKICSSDIYSIILFTLYSIITSYSSISSSFKQQMIDNIQEFEQQAQPITTEQRLLITAITRRIKQVADTQGAADTLAANLMALQHQSQLTKSQVERILAACTDTRLLSEGKQRSINVITVQQAARKLLTHQFTMEAEALSSLVEALENANPLICAAAAMLLRHCKTLPHSVREEVARKIMDIMANDMLSHRPIDPPNFFMSRLDDVLFQTLITLAE